MKASVVTIKKIGSLIYANVDGVLISDIDPRRLQPEWFVVAEEFVARVIKIFQHKIYSIYLRGSVANGTAIQSISDVDFCIISLNHLTNNEKEFIRQIASEINNSNTFITRFDIGFYTADEIISVKEKVLLKLRSICMYGNVLADQITDPRSGRDVCVTLLGLESEIIKTRDEIVHGLYTPENVAATCKWMAKRVVRSGLELVSKREGCYTRDLYPCWKTFSEYYPQYQREMERVLELAISPSVKVEDLESILKLGAVVCDLAKTDTDFLA